MNASQIIERLSATFANAIVDSFNEDDSHPRVHIYAKDWRPMAEYLKTDAELDFDFLLCISAVDYVADNEFAAVYDLRSMTHGHEFCVKVLIDREKPTIASVMDLWPAADWHEREAFDMMGLIFEGHEDLRRILLPEDWEGFPLRKDYEFPREYHGIPGTTELDWQQKPDYPM